MEKVIKLADNKKLAILFDIENISPEDILPVSITKLEEQGFIVYPRKIIFNNVSQLKKSFLGPAIKSYHLDLICAYAGTGKNIADFRLYIEVLDMLYKNPDIDGFCIVSGDADFAELVIKLRHEGKYVIGIGPNSKSKPEYVALFNQFFFIEDLLVKEEKKIVKEKKPKSTKELVTPKKEKRVIKKRVPKKINASQVVEKIIHTESDKDQIYYTELKNCINEIINEYSTKGTKEIFYSNLVKEIKDRSSFLESFTRITFDDIEKCGYHLTRKEEDKPETSFIATSTTLSA